MFFQTVLHVTSTIAGPVTITTSLNRTHAAFAVTDSMIAICATLYNVSHVIQDIFWRMQPATHVLPDSQIQSHVILLWYFHV